jgi:hypothetical protein
LTSTKVRVSVSVYTGLFGSSYVDELVVLFFGQNAPFEPLRHN